MPPGQKERRSVKKFLSITSPAIYAANNPRTTSIEVATKLCTAFLAISLKDLLAKRHPTEDPKINKH